MAALALGLGALTVTGLVQLWHVYVFAFLSGCVAAFDAPARQTFVHDLVGDTDLPNAVALNSTSFNAGRMIGPAAAGISIAALGSGWAPPLGAQNPVSSSPRRGRPYLAQGGSTGGLACPQPSSAQTGRVFVTPRRVRFVESEYAVPRESLPGVLTELRRAVPRLADPVMFPVEVRVAAADDIWLSTAYGRDSAYIAIHQYTGLPYRAYFDLFESVVAGAAGRPHWGKMHSLDAARLGPLYPRFDDFRRVRAQVDPEDRFGNRYLSRVFGPAG